MSGRQQFLRDATSNIAAMAAPGAVPPRAPNPSRDEWDLAWPTRLTGTHRSISGGTEIESGATVFWRRSLGLLSHDREAKSKPKPRHVLHRVRFRST